MQCGVDFPSSLPLLGFQTCVWCPENLTWQCCGCSELEAGTAGPAPGVSRGKSVDEDGVYGINHVFMELPIFGNSHGARLHLRNNAKPS